MQVIDFKYGAGVPVSAENNPQTRLYGLGALERFDALYDIQKVLMTVIQPRLDSISSEELPAGALILWGDVTVRPKAELAETGRGEYVPGEHCRFCKAKIRCRARAEHNLQLAVYEFKPAPDLSTEEISDVLNRIDELVNWAGQVKDFALDQAVNFDKHWPGWKLVEGRSNRKYSNEEAVATTLIGAGYEDALIYEKKLLGITAMEKAIGKKPFAQLLTELVIKPAGKPTLAPESDPRPAYNSAAAAAEDFRQ
jgi:hypothetical protein